MPDRLARLVQVNVVTPSGDIHAYTCINLYTALVIVL